MNIRLGCCSHMRQSLCFFQTVPVLVFATRLQTRTSDNIFLFPPLTSLQLHFLCVWPSACLRSDPYLPSPSLWIPPGKVLHTHQSGSAIYSRTISKYGIIGCCRSFPCSQRCLSERKRREMREEEERQPETEERREAGDAERWHACQWCLCKGKQWLLITGPSFN